MSSFSKLLTRRRFLWLSALTGGTLVLGGCADESASTESGGGTTFDNAAAPGDAAADDTAADGAAAEDYTQVVADRLKAMTLEQKVAQLFMVAPEALVEDISQVTQAGEMTHEGVTRWPVGGIVYFAQNLLEPTQTTDMLANVKQLYEEDGNVAPFLGVDEEGGSVVRIADNEAFGVEDVGDASALGSGGDAAAAKQAAETLAGYLKPLGFNLDFAPVADVVDPSRSDTMGLRSFSSDPAVAADMVRAEVEGFESAGLLCCAKHFPGIGAAAGDSHDGSITIEKTVDELEEVDLVPFQAAIEAGVPLIMVGHLSLPNVIGDDTPAPLSAKVVQELLRDKLGYQGIVMTDSLSMGAIADHYNAAEAAVGALQAGCDMPLMPENFSEAYQGVLDAVAAEQLTEERIDQSVTRILTAKAKYLGL
ncbi:glycoside hydrolase family 3 protein [Adlercreutzia equolifaciens]|uniref:glycoside hydrolase family 3 protein n=1 Tax=Adlercreutzia equolifaciens TaxID=446660 RepID=UPI0023B19DB7|nr:glycoside hydrolase family 3 protein [Adlercreutzia equolifaciens]MDE8701889.1 glycoside hydrolase family 3 protein [Adlercreutzia equolifaciens]